MIFKIVLVLITGIFYEMINLFKVGILDNPIAFGFLKILIFMALRISIISINIFNLGLIKKITKVIPPIIESDAKVLMTPIKSPKKEWYLSGIEYGWYLNKKNNLYKTKFKYNPI